MTSKSPFQPKVFYDSIAGVRARVKMKEFLAPALLFFFLIPAPGAPLLLPFKDTAGLSGRLGSCPLGSLTAGDLCQKFSIAKCHFA